MIKITFEDLDDIRIMTRKELKEFLEADGIRYNPYDCSCFLSNEAKKYYKENHHVTMIVRDVVEFKYDDIYLIDYYKHMGTLSREEEEKFWYTPGDKTNCVYVLDTKVRKINCNEINFLTILSFEDYINCLKKGHCSLFHKGIINELDADKSVFFSRDGYILPNELETLEYFGGIEEFVPDEVETHIYEHDGLKNGNLLDPNNKIVTLEQINYWNWVASPLYKAIAAAVCTLGALAINGSPLWWIGAWFIHIGFNCFICNRVNRIYRMHMIEYFRNKKISNEYPQKYYNYYTERFNEIGRDYEATFTEEDLRRYFYERKT